jgi:creatinine amidohydrolase
MDLKDLSWPQVEEYLKNKKEILLPIGSVEEHGYHLPLSTDGDIAYAVCSALSQRTGILVAPIVWYGYSRSTRAYRGTVMVGLNALKDYIRGIIDGLIESGFEKVYIVSGHFSRDHIEVLKKVAKEAPIKVDVLDFSKIDFTDILESTPMHACEAETSLMLYLCPQKVDMGKAVDEKIEFEDEMLKRTKSGVFGTPTLASEEKGRLIFERIISKLETLL